MASEKEAIASGLDAETQAARRRNVPSNSPNGGLVDRIEVDDKKTQKKKVCTYSFNSLGLCQEIALKFCANK